MESDYNDTKNFCLSSNISYIPLHVKELLSVLLQYNAFSYNGILLCKFILVLKGSTL